jgi:RimJ/RimL family protein N-acetyltransferase
MRLPPACARTREPADPASSSIVGWLASEDSLRFTDSSNPFAQISLILRGSKTVLRPLRLSDAARLHAWNCDATINPEGARYRATVLSERGWIRAVRKLRTDTYFALDNDVGDHIGLVSLNGVSSMDRSAVASILIGRRWWSHGYGSDAMRAILKFAFGERRLHRVTLYVLATNLRALALYRRLGFRKEGVLRENVLLHGEFVDEIILGILRSEWQRRQNGSKKSTLGTRDGARRRAAA